MCAWRSASLIPYEIGMSFLGEKILYELLNRHENWWCEQRAFMPWVDMKEQMERLHIPLYCLESKDPLTDFDIVWLLLGIRALLYQYPCHAGSGRHSAARCGS